MNRPHPHVPHPGPEFWEWFKLLLDDCAAMACLIGGPCLIAWMVGIGGVL
jgi:hypothetical protein